MLLVSGLAFAQASATGTATADILASITISQNRGLDFGIIAPASVGATEVTVAATLAGTRTLTSGSGVLITGGGETSGEFLVEAADTYAYTVDIPTTAITIDDAGTGVPMAIDLTLSGTAGTGGGTGVPTSFYVGGTLTVPAGQVAGTYNGSYTITAIYN